MRQLNNKEMEQISGGCFGIFDKIGTSIGAAIGNFVDRITAVGGLVTNATEAGTLIGSGVGKILELNISGAISDIGGGVVSIIDSSLSVIKQLFGNK